MRPLLTLACALWLSAVVSAQTPYVTTEQLTVGATAGGLTAATINQGAGHPQANYAICRLETADIRVRIDGTVPTSTVGTQILINDTILLGGNEVLNKFSAIRSGAVSGVLNCTYLDARPVGSPAFSIISASATSSGGGGATETTLLAVQAAVETIDNVVSVDGVNISQWAGATPAATNPIPVRLSDGAAFANVASDHTRDVAIAAAAQGPLSMGLASTATPTTMSADNDAAPFWLDRVGRLHLVTEGVEDAGETAAGFLSMVGSVRRDTLASSAGLTGDNATINTNSVGALYTQPSAGVNGGASSLKRTSAGATEDEHEVKGSAGILYSIAATNINAAARYLRCADQVAASTTPGTTTPIIDLAIPGNTAGAGFTHSFPVGLQFATGLTCWFVTGAADTDVAEVAANEIKALYTFK